MIDPDDLAAFRAAVAGAQALAPVNRIETRRPRPAPLPRTPRAGESGPAEKPAKRGEAPLPAFWNSEDPEVLRKRALNPELAAFHVAMNGVKPLPNPNRVELGSVRPAPQARQFIADEQAALHESLFGLIALQDRLEGGDEPQYLRHGVAQNVLRDLRRGRWVIQGEVDLHGCNRDQAREQLAHFLAECLHQGKRCIRVIHGKGHGSPQKLSVLRQLVRGWLMQRQEILAFCQAKPQDGGEGALLVLLRAARKKTG
ncbi:Smr/MutS family protein [Dechloromonas sp. ZY10]|uniref:Smr/MutS family protein n=1 Tax=Dechloromonas aquae TaxID=2664436 RepID=UPI0035281825